MRPEQRATRGAAVGALLAYSGVVVSLTMLKQYFSIGYLWDPSKPVSYTHLTLPTNREV